MPTASQAQGIVLSIENLQMMMEIGKFCGMVAAGAPSDDLHAALHELMSRLETHFAEEEALMKDRRFHSEGHRQLHSIILAELAKLDHAFEGQDAAFDKDMLKGLRRMFVAESEFDGVFEDSLRSKREV